MEDAVANLINYILFHIEDAKTHARVLYLDMSSAFSTLQPHLLFKKLIFEFKLESELVLWVLNFWWGDPNRFKQITPLLGYFHWLTPRMCLIPSFIHSIHK